MLKLVCTENFALFGLYGRELQRFEYLILFIWLEFAAAVKHFYCNSKFQLNE